MFGVTKSQISANTLRGVVVQQRANKGWLAVAIGKFNKIYHGSENPIVKKDPVQEEMEKAGQYRFPRPFARTVFLRNHARARVVRNNAHIRKLEAKVTGSVIGMKSMENRF